MHLKKNIFVFAKSLFIFIFVFCLHCPCSVVVAQLLVCPLFLLMLLLYSCLFVDHVNKTLIFVFGAFVYCFKNTIFIFVTLLNQFSIWQLSELNFDLYCFSIVYFYDFLLADFCQKVWESIKIGMKSFSKNLSFGVDFKL